MTKKKLTQKLMNRLKLTKYVRDSFVTFNSLDEREEYYARVSKRRLEEREIINEISRIFMLDDDIDEYFRDYDALQQESNK